LLPCAALLLLLTAKQTCFRTAAISAVDRLC
jgi:hypothetical protein